MAKSASQSSGARVALVLTTQRTIGNVLMEAGATIGHVDLVHGVTAADLDKIINAGTATAVPEKSAKPSESASA